MTDLGQNKEAPQFSHVSARCSNAKPKTHNKGCKNAQVDCVKCSVSTTGGILLCMGHVQHAGHADLRKVLGPNG